VRSLIAQNIDGSGASVVDQSVPDSEDKHSTVNDSGRVLIGVCTLNEAENIGPLIEQLKESLPEADILIVDDNSADNTGVIVGDFVRQDPSIILCVRKDERGLGTAIRHAMAYAIDNGYTHFLNLDGDFSHDPRQLPSLLNRIRAEPAVDVVIGSRYVSGGSIVGWPMRRKIMSGIVNRFAKLCLRLPVKDCSGSMRCYQVASLKEIGVSNLKSTGYSVLEELLLQLHRRGAKFAEVPITFTERQQGESKLTMPEAIRSAWRMVLMAVQQS
jgi:dolichol-phosphate mannosyltransferase